MCVSIKFEVTILRLLEKMCEREEEGGRGREGRGESITNLIGIYVTYLEEAIINLAGDNYRQCFTFKVANIAYYFCT